MGATEVAGGLRSEALLALARKYRALSALQRAKARGEAPPPRGYFQSLACEFPGALRELDTLPASELDRRACALEHAEAHGAGRAEPWMAWQHDYHRWMRAALMIKMSNAREGARAGPVGSQLSDVQRATGVEVDVEFLVRCVRPPRGRLKLVVTERVAALHGVAVEDIHVALFGRPARAVVALREAAAGV